MLLSVSKASSTDSTLIVYTEEWPPFNYLNEKGEIDGISTLKVREVLESIGIDYEIRLVPWIRAFTIASDTPNTLIYSLFKTPERTATFEFLCPLTEQPQSIALFRLTERNDINIRQLSDAKQYISGVIRGDFAVEYLVSQGFAESSQLLVSSDEHANIRQLFSHRVDLIVQSEAAMTFRLKQLGLPRERVTKVLDSIDGNYHQPCLGINKKSDPQLIRALRSAFTL